MLEVFAIVTCIIPLIIGGRPLCERVGKSQSETQISKPTRSFRLCRRPPALGDDADFKPKTIREPGTEKHLSKTKIACVHPGCEVSDNSGARRGRSMKPIGLGTGCSLSGCP